MKKLFLITGIAMLPFITVAQQKNNSTIQLQQLQQEMQQLQQQLQDQVKALQDSIAMLHDQLKERDAERKGEQSWFRNHDGSQLHFYAPDPHVLIVPPLPPHGEDEWSRGFNYPEQWDFKYELPEMPELPQTPDVPYYDNMPREFHFDWNNRDFDFSLPRFPDRFDKKRNHPGKEFLEMLPFYHFFKS